MARLAMVAAGMQLGPPALADVCDLVQRGLAVRARGDNDASIYYLGQAISTGTLASNNLAAVPVSRGAA